MIRLLCTFTTIDDLENTIFRILSNYTILNNKIFILKLKQTGELICTYTIDSNNFGSLIENTILIHRQKETNTLYTINSLNMLIKQLNNNVFSKDYLINWHNYKNMAIFLNDKHINIYNLDIYHILDI